MTTFLAAFAVVCLGIVAFVARLGIQQARLLRTMEEIRSKQAGLASVEPAANDQRRPSRASVSRAA
jgi:hypothetical protein